ncbi:hypothetical protein COO60DRAFT_220743 [Scenedesmus sp. NREL 46B-D3]|nr:hypothetical protein COO60DRAFT_220743 [Scenedesmus sp. NREL 46B-D3]
MDVLGAAKGLTGLLTDSSSWLEQLLQVHTIKQLHEFAASTLPTLAKQYPRNSRVQSLLRSIYASMQGQLVELTDDTYAPSYATSAAGDAPAAVLTPTEADGHQRQQSLQRQSGPLAEGFEGFKGRFGSKRQQAKASQQQQRDGTDEDDEMEVGEAAADEEQEVMAAAAAVAAAINAGAATAAAMHSGSSSSSSHQGQPVEPAAVLASLAEASSSGSAEAGVMADGARQQRGSAAALAAYAASTAAAATVQPAKAKKKAFGKGLMMSMVSGKGKSKPEPSPEPELCSAPAALAAHAALEAMLSEAEAEVAAGEQEAAAAAAAAARTMGDSTASASTSHSSAAGLADPSEQQGSGRLTPQMGLQGQHAQVGNDDSAFSKAGDEGVDSSEVSSMCSLSAAFQRPPDLPWEASPGQGRSAAAARAAAAAAGALAGTAECSPRSVAVAAAQFESRIAQQSSRRLSHLSSNQIMVGVGAATPPRVSQPPSPRVLAEEELELDDAAAFELAQVSGDGAVETSDPVAGSPRSARRFHFFKFRSILQHHEKLSTQALAEAEAAAAALEAAAAKEGDSDAAASGTSARIRAVLSMRRRTTAASAASAAVAAVDGEVAANAEEGGVHVGGEAACTADAADAASGAAVSGVSPRASQCDDVYDAADVPASMHGIADVLDQPYKQGRIGGLMSRAASRMMSLGSRPAREPAATAAPSAGAGSSQQARQSFKGLNFTAKLKKAMVDRRGNAEATIDGTLLPTLQLDSVPPLACLLQLRALLEQLMHEIKTETKKHLMMQLQMAAAAAAGGGSAKPDASIARPLRQVKAMIKAVHRMQLALDYPRQLAAAADMSGLWLSRAYSGFFAAEQQQVKQLKSPPAACLAAVLAAEQPQQQGVEGTRLYNLLFDAEQSEGSLRFGSCSSAAQQRAVAVHSPTATPFADASCQEAAGGTAAAGTAAASGRASRLASFPAALLAGCMRQLQRLPAELPLLVLHLFWDARGLLQRTGLLSMGLQLLRQQEEACVCCYVQQLVPAAYEHFKRIASHQTVTYELLSSCGARTLQPVQPLLLDALLREPCPLVLQGDYSAVACTAEGQPAQPGSLPGCVLLQGPSGRPAGDGSASGAEQQQLAAEQLQVIHELQEALQALQQEQEAVGQQTLLEQQQQQLHGDGQQVPQAPSPGPAYGSKSLPVSQAASPEKLSSAAAAGAAQQKKRQGHRSKRRAAAAKAAADDDAAPAAVAGQTPLMQRLEQLKLAQQLMQAQQQQAAQAVVDAESCSVADVRQWLLAGLLSSLKKDVAAVVARSRLSSPSAVVEVQVQAAILQRTHQLLSQYAPLPCSWPQLWGKADAADAAASSNGSSCDSACARAVADRVLAMLDTAVYDSEALVLLPAAADAPAAAGLPAAAGVLAEVSAALRPLVGFFGRQHLQALLALAGPAGQAHLLEGLMNKLDEEQGFLLEQLQMMQQQLPPALLQLPPAERYHTAGAVLQFYQQHLSSTLGDSDGACSAALACLQRIGNCLALLHLLTMQQSVQATPAFMQVAPLLGIVGRPLTDAAAAAECFEYEGAADPPTVQTAGGFASRSCAAGLLMPEVEQLLPSDSARHAHELQVQKELQQEQAWRQHAAQQGQPFDASLLKPGGELARHRMWQASHFQRLLLGPDAEKVRGPALLLTQTAELRAWRAAQAQECMGPCMERLRRWACVLQRQLQGLAGEADESEEDEVQVPAGAAAGVHAGNDAAAAAAGQQQYLGGLAGRLPGELAVGASLAGEVAAGEVAGIGVRENTLYGSAMTPPDSPYKEQQQQLAALDQQHELAAKSPAQADKAANSSRLLRRMRLLWWMTI